MEQCAQRAGEIFNAPVIGKTPTVLFVSHPKAIQTIFSPDTGQITAPSNQLLMPIVGDRSIFCMEGASHRRERKLLMPPFHRENLTHYGALICQLTNGAMQCVSPGNAFAARDLMQDISLEVILKVVFGIFSGTRFDTLKALIVELTNGFQNPLMGGALFFPALQRDLGSRSPWGHFLAIKRQIDQVLMDEIRARRFQDATDRSDILTLLMAARDEAGQPMSDEELRDELIALLLAGHETTATMVAWALYWIHHDRRIRETLLAELHSLGDEPDPMAIAQLPYLTAVCNEAMRIYPVAMLTVPREVREPMNLMGYSLEPGTRLYGCIYSRRHINEDII
jgi:unspecific monooxygenase